MKSTDIDAIIFDMGGTLLDYDPVPAGEMRVIRAERIAAFLNAKGYRLSAAAVDEHLIAPYHHQNMVECEKTLREVDLCACVRKGLERLKVAEDYTLWVIGLVHRILKENLVVYGDSMEALEKLSAKYPLGLVSNTTIPGVYFANDLEEIGMAKYFRHCLFTADWGFRKPHASTFYRMLELLGAEADRSLYVGDSFRNDIYGPSQIGMKTAWINPGRRPRPDGFGSLAPDYEIKSVGELAGIILSGD
jgi:putative hydrolase of the HAD superfamily